MINLSDILIGTAHAQDAVAGTGSGGFGSLVPLIIIFFIFYFLLIRPQQKKVKEHQQMVVSLKRKDKVVTAGGIIGTISKVNSDNETLEIEIASGVEVTVLKNTVSEIVTRTASAGDSDKEKSGNSKKDKKK